MFMANATTTMIVHGWIAPIIPMGDILVVLPVSADVFVVAEDKKSHRRLPVFFDVFCRGIFPAFLAKNAKKAGNFVIIFCR